MSNAKAPLSVRQGDILLIQVNSVPSEFQSQRAGPLTLGYGEATGHHHVLEMGQWAVGPDIGEADLHQFALGRKTIPVFVVVESETTLTHQEHAPLSVAPGVWQVVRQREYVPGPVRSRVVID